MRRVWRLLPALLLATACEATGMGWIPSSIDPTEKATFGFVFDSTPPSDTSGSFTFSGSYHDHAAGVTFKGTGVMKSSPPPAGMKIKGGCIAGEPMYESRDRSIPSTGTLTLIICDADGDGGMGVDGEDFVAIIVTSGPYAGYQNSGSPSGNITVTQP